MGQVTHFTPGFNLGTQFTPGFNAVVRTYANVTALKEVNGDLIAVYTDGSEHIVGGTGEFPVLINVGAGESPTVSGTTLILG